MVVVLPPNSGVSMLRAVKPAHWEQLKTSGVVPLAYHDTGRVACQVFESQEGHKLAVFAILEGKHDPRSVDEAFDWLADVASVVYDLLWQAPLLNVDLIYDLPRQVFNSLARKTWAGAAGVWLSLFEDDNERVLFEAVFGQLINGRLDADRACASGEPAVARAGRYFSVVREICGL